MTPEKLVEKVKNTRENYHNLKLEPCNPSLSSTGPASLKQCDHINACTPCNTQGSDCVGDGTYGDPKCAQAFCDNPAPGCEPKPDNCCYWNPPRGNGNNTRIYDRQLDMIWSQKI